MQCQWSIQHELDCPVCFALKLKLRTSKETRLGDVGCTTVAGTETLAHEMIAAGATGPDRWFTGCLLRDLNQGIRIARPSD